MKISYLVTCNNETDTLKRLLEKLGTFIRTNDDELVVVVDEGATDNQATKDLLGELAAKMGEEWLNKKLKILQHPLNDDYGAHKNWGTQQCTGDWIFQIDADEIPSDTLLVNLHDIIDANPDVELIFVPRMNDFKGVTPQIAAQWGWRLSPSPTCGNRPLVNWPDWQGRIYKRVPDRIKWDRKLHEKIQGHDRYSMLPMDEDLALHHDKPIEKQVQTNLSYNKRFSVEENKGHTVV